MEEFKCVICSETVNEWGNNPYPIAEEGQCCDNCNDKVIDARMNNILIRETL